ncbi:hypothetical protein HZA38_00345 [Candidatus Peregrinibacteria bacterium]|nr:hypothetical protein [Candidatus Peregrinibacteria bacterium]
MKTVYAMLGGAVQKYELFPKKTEKFEPSKYLTRYEIATAICQFLKNRED